MQSKYTTTIIIILLAIIAAAVIVIAVKKPKGEGVETLTSTQSTIQSTSTPDTQKIAVKPVEPKQVTSSQKSYQGDGFSFMYADGAQATSTALADRTSVSIKKGDKSVDVLFFSGALPSTFRPEFYTFSVVLNGETFYYGDVQTEGGMMRSYMYKKSGKTILIGGVVANQNDNLVNLGSIEVQ